MDYAVLSTLAGSDFSWLIISYDIACQWSKNFRHRISDFPPHLHFKPDDRDFTTVIPKFHIYAHGKKCQTCWSLNYFRWMGRTDGEGVEREWSHINPVALSTNLMGPGSRHDTLNDHWGAWNWQKVVGLGTYSYYMKSPIIQVLTCLCRPSPLCKDERGSPHESKAPGCV